MVSGERMQLGSDAEARVTPDGLDARVGDVKRLTRVPTSPGVLPLAEGGEIGSRAGATRFREVPNVWAEIAVLYPRDGEVVLADETELGFEPIPGIEAYRIDVEDEVGKTVLSLETKASQVQVPAGVLKPGTLYLWRVRTIGGLRPLAAAEVVFATLEQEQVEARSALAREASDGSSADVYVLLAEIDWRLGLHWRACQDLARALELAPSNPALVEGLKRLDCGTAAD
jgi:hypothetical protein